MLLIGTISGYAQFDNNYLWNYYYQQQQSNAAMNQMMQQIFGMLDNVVEEQKKNAKLSAYVIPGSENHRFGVFVFLSFYSLRDIKVVYTDTNGDSYSVNYSSGTISGPFLHIPDILGPGYMLNVYRVSDGALLQHCKIPAANTASYARFGNVLQQNLSIVNALIGSGNNSYGSGNKLSEDYSSSGVVCKACHGTGICGTCHGKGYYQGSYGVGTLKCPNCSAADGHICSVCNGTGRW